MEAIEKCNNCGQELPPSCRGVDEYYCIENGEMHLKYADLIVDWFIKEGKVDIIHTKNYIPDISNSYV